MEPIRIPDRGVITTQKHWKFLDIAYYTKILGWYDYYPKQSIESIYLL